jgi:fluoroacetyl-CoA thioesterase
MRDGLVPGMVGEVRITVTEAMLATFDELGQVHPVYSTWTMVKHLEEASRKVILPFLDTDEDAVGHSIDVVHLAPTPAGAWVLARAIVDRVEGRRIHCRLEAYNARERIGEGHNVQVVVSRERLRQRFQTIGALK